MKRFGIAVLVWTLLAPGLATLTAQGTRGGTRGGAVPAPPNDAQGQGAENREQNQGRVFTVPDSGSTALLLVMSLIGLFGVAQLVQLVKRRRRSL